MSNRYSFEHLDRTDDIPQHEPGAKLDTGKPRCSLVLGAFANALLEVSRVGTFGADKYSDNGWLEVPNGQQRYADALHRHLLLDASGEVVDSESELSHKAHAAWNALAILELELRLKTIEAAREELLAGGRVLVHGKHSGVLVKHPEPAPLGRVWVRMDISYDLIAYYLDYVESID